MRTFTISEIISKQNKCEKIGYEKIVYIFLNSALSRKTFPFLFIHLPWEMKAKNQDRNEITVNFIKK